MFDNILFQSATRLLSDDIRRDTLPPSLLFSGPTASGKLSCALELARVISCRERGEWNCTCPSCLRTKALVTPSLLVIGAGNRTLEIAAAAATLKSERAASSPHLEASRYLYLRAVRKLTLRFNAVLWQDDDKFSKCAPQLQAIEEALEELEPGRAVPAGSALDKLLDGIQTACDKLEGGFLYDSIPVLQIRNVSAWAHVSAANGKKVVVIENADRMLDSARNALLKILEEPPADTLFILTTSRRGAMLPTILSRVRTYTFFPRSAAQQQEVVFRVFHSGSLEPAAAPVTITGFLQSYLPVPPEIVQDAARQYFAALAENHLPDIPRLVKACGNFTPRMLCELFFTELIEQERPLLRFPAGAEAAARALTEIRRAYNEITVYNINPAAALEELSRALMLVSATYPGTLKEALP